MHGDAIMDQNSVVWALLISFQNLNSESNVTRSDFLFYPVTPRF